MIKSNTIFFLVIEKIKYKKVPVAIIPKCEFSEKIVHLFVELISRKNEQDEEGSLSDLISIKLYWNNVKIVNERIKILTIRGKTWKILFLNKKAKIII